MLYLAETYKATVQSYTREQINSLCWLAFRKLPLDKENETMYVSIYHKWGLSSVLKSVSVICHLDYQSYISIVPCLLYIYI